MYIIIILAQASVLPQVKLFKSKCNILIPAVIQPRDHKINPLSINLTCRVTIQDNRRAKKVKVNHAGSVSNQPTENKIGVQPDKRTNNIDKQKEVHNKESRKHRKLNKKYI